MFSVIVRGAFLDHLKTFIKVFSFFKEKKERIINDAKIVST